MNIQPIEKRDACSNGATLDVHSIFLTIQGEGPFCGTPCVFVRLAGCNLQCPGCDTDYTSRRKRMGPYEIFAEVNELWRKHEWRPGLVVITGGEPFRQNLSRLFNVLCRNGYYIQIETNGTLQPTLCEPGTSEWKYQPHIRLHEREGVYVVCSPKTGQVNSGIFMAACALKYVVKAGSVRQEDGLPLSALDHTSNPYPARPPAFWNGLVYVQPMDEKDAGKNANNLHEAIASCMRHGYTLQVQMHKVIGVA